MMSWMYTWFWCFFSKRDRSLERRTVTLGCGDEFCDNTVTSSKYNIITFLPLNFYEQFHRPINFYFVVVAALQFIPSISPVSPYTTLMPLTVAFMICACREGYDDIMRHLQDNANNSRLYRVIDGETEETMDTKSKKIRVGDLLLLRPLDIVPCDVILLLSSTKFGEFFISTENLDGETGAKERISLLQEYYHSDILTSMTSEDSNSPPHIISDALNFLKKCDLKVDSEGPNPNLHAYTGTATIHPNGSKDSRILGITAENVVLSSSVVRSTRYAVGLVVFTGNETKVVMTRNNPPMKWADIDQKYNEMTILVFGLQTVLLIIFTIFACLRLKRAEGMAWYLGMTEGATPLYDFFPVLPLRFFSMITPMVPISFKTTVDISKLYISHVISWDKEISDHGVEAKVNNSALAEDLGRIEYVLSDKTGTLTRNVMSFKYLADTEGTMLSASNGKQATTRKKGREEERFRNLLRAMVFCNTLERTPSSVFSSRTESKASAQMRNMWLSSSPDEIALAEGAGYFGYTLLERTRHSAFVRLGDQSVESARILKVLKFSSERGRMSVLVEIQNSGYIGALLLTKGSDERVLPLCLRETMEGSKVDSLLDSFSCKGLRTLVYGYRVVPPAEMHKWFEAISRAEALPLADDRRHAVDKAYDLLERDLTYCGITAIEDELQEQAADTIKQLREAGVRVWMLTGDKNQTARQIAIASGLLTPDDAVVNLTPPNYGTMTITEHVEYVRERIKYLRAKPVVVESEERAKRKLFSWYARSGMSVFVNEFLKPHRSPALLEPVCHPLRSRLFDRMVTDYFENTDDEYILSPDMSPCRVAPDFNLYADAFMGQSPNRAHNNMYHTNINADTISVDNQSLSTRYTCGLLGKTTQESVPLLVNDTRTSNGSTDACEHHGSPEKAPAVLLPKHQGYSITIAGATIQLLNEPAQSELLHDFQTVLLHASTVICSRTMPDQKAFIVKSVKSAGKITLAIGDGGNDVAMLQEAHVGVGIHGQEGQQAALASDFVIAKFRFLAKLMLVHGHIALQRSSMIVQQSFWKTVVIAWVQLMYNIYTDFSGVSYWSSFSLAMYNAIFTVPATFLCVLNVPLSPWMLMNNPRLYQITQQGRYLNAATFYGYILRGIVQGTIMGFVGFVLQRGAGMGSVGETGRPDVDFHDAYLATYFAVVTVHVVTVAIESHTIVFLQWGSFFLAFVSLMFMFGAVSVLTKGSEQGSFQESMRSPFFYLSWIIISAATLVPQGMYAAIKLAFFPDVLQLQRLFNKHINTELPKEHILRNLFRDDNPSALLYSLSPAGCVWEEPVPQPYYSIGDEYLGSNMVATPFDDLNEDQQSDDRRTRTRSLSLDPYTSLRASNAVPVAADTFERFSQPFLRRSRSVYEPTARS